LKEILSSPKILKKPRWDLPMCLQCDASDIGIGAVLYQIDENNVEHVIEFYSNKLTENEKKFSPTEKECLAVIKAIIHFRPYIELVPLRIITDHHSLKYLLNMKVTSGRLARWILFLSPYINCIEHRSGKLNVVPDALSRAPVMNEDENSFLENLNEIEDQDSDYDNLKFQIMSNYDKFQNYRITNDVIYQKIPYKRNIFDDDWKIVPKNSLRQSLIQKSHENCMHGGVKSTIYDLQKNYYWKGIRKDVKNWIKGCVKCACVKAPNYKLSGPILSSRIPQKCMEVVSIDIKGPFPAGGRQRYQYVLVMMDLLSRFVWYKLFHSVKSFHVVNFQKQ
jgi:hypothetical protein